MNVAVPAEAQWPTAIGRQLGLREGDALLVVDVQRDFLPGGSLPVPEGDQVIAPLNAYIAAFEAQHLPVFLTRCWHPEDHISFRSAGGPWPPHCVKGTPGADWPSDLKVPDDAHVISKATDKLTEAYSGFSGTALQPLLQKQQVRRVFVGGLATDYCVHDTVMAARERGFDVVVLADAIRAINANPGDETRAITAMIKRGATLHERSRQESRRKRRERQNDGGDVSFTTVGSVCSREVIVAEPQETLRTAAELMQTHRVGSLVVCEEADGRRMPAGMVTDRDIVLAVLKHGTDLNSLHVRHAMSADPLVLSEDEDVSQALDRLRARAVRRAPVVDATGALVGIASIDDLLAVLISQLNSIGQIIERQTQAPSARADRGG